MTMLAVCVILAVTGQGWDKPVIQEAELAAPVGIERIAPEDAPTQAPQSPESAESATEDTSGGGQADDSVQELRWEYDEEGRPVARPSVQESGAELPEQAQPKQDVSPVQEPRETPKRPRSSERLVTFWFVMPKE